MHTISQYLLLTSLQMKIWRNEVLFIIIVQVALTLGLVLGFGYIIPDVSDRAALFLATGTATNTLITVGLVMLPQVVSQAKAEGRLDYMLTLPISREA